MSNAHADERFPRELEILRHLADGLPQIVWVARPDGSHEYYNKRWREYTGLELEESTDDAWAALFHPDDRERAVSAWAEALRQGTPYDIEFRLKRVSDGAYRWFLGRALAYRNVRPRGADLPVIALTAYASVQDRERAIHAGFDRHLTKPVDPVELVRTIAGSLKAR